MKRAIVLSGGGSRGAYQIGVWQALAECGVDYQIVTGTSIGALNGALMAQGDLNLALEIWNNLDAHSVLDATLVGTEANPTAQDLFKIFLREALQHNGADITPLENIVLQALDEPKIRHSAVALAIVTVKYPSFAPLELTLAQIPQGQLADYLLASAACHPAFKVKEIDGTKYIDGGFYDNLPVGLALSLGADELIAVDLHAVGLKRQVKTDKTLLYIDCYWDLGPMLFFDPKQAQRNIALGYCDAMKALGRQQGLAFTFDPLPQALTSKLYYQLLLTIYAFFFDQLNNHNQKHLTNLLQRSLHQLLRNRNMPDKTLTNQQFVLLCAEICGELLALDETQCYTLQVFNQSLIEKLLNDMATVVVYAQWQTVTPLSDQTLRVIHYYFLIKDCLERPSDDHPNKNQLLSAEGELLAAFYLYVLTCH